MCYKTLREAGLHIHERVIVNGTKSAQQLVKNAALDNFSAQFDPKLPRAKARTVDGAGRASGRWADCAESAAVLIVSVRKLQRRDLPMCCRHCSDRSVVRLHMQVRGGWLRPSKGVGNLD
jgi:hypothetical protein